MNKVGLFFILILFSSGIESQNWNLFNYDQKSCYKQTSDGIIKVESFNFDSLKINGDDEIQYFNRKIGLSNACYDVLINELNWMSWDLNPDFIDSLVIRNDSVFFITDYFTPEPDTLLFLTHSELGESWVTTQNEIEISCTEKLTESIFGIEDSIKVFSILTEPYDTIEFVLSKTYGLLKFLTFREFIYHNQNNDFEDYFELAGFENNSQKKGYVQASFKDYFKLNPGDMLYWRHYSNPDDISFPEVISYQIDSITYSFLSDDSVYYQYAFKNYSDAGNLTYSGTGSDYYTNSRQGKLLSTPSRWFNVRIPGNFNGDVIFTEAIYLSINDNDTLTNYGYSFWGLVLDTASCISDWVADVDQTLRFSSREGLIYSAAFSWGESSKTLIGSVIDGIVYGDINIPNTVSFHNNSEILLFPNPSEGTINIHTKDKLISTTVLSSTGIPVFKTAESSFYSEKLTPGIYILIIETNTGKFSKKLIIEK